MVGFIKSSYHGYVMREELVFSRSYLDDLDNYTNGSFWLTPQVNLGGELRPISIHHIRKEVA
jgi:hypothetical protein